MSKLSRSEELPVLKHEVCARLRSELTTAGEIIKDLTKGSDEYLIANLPALQSQVDKITTLVQTFRAYDTEVV